jgi:uncharacterized 2Fe-2S/4Fe-4S cluster protein (DUF4445 family)
VSDTITHKITLKPTNVELSAPAGTPLRDLLFEQGVEFPCGGHGRCRGCKVRVIAGATALNDAQRKLLKPAEIEAGWRLACQLTLDSDMTIELRQWDAAILADDAAFTFTPREGYGVAVDLGTTTLVAQLLDLQTSDVLAVRTALNAQARHGADVMSRVGFAVSDGGQPVLEKLIREQIGKLIRDLVYAAGVDAGGIRDVTVVGNTVMHHFFCGIDIDPLSHYPFEPVNDGLQVFGPADLGWTFLTGNPTIRFLPCLGSFVGSDITAGVIATKLYQSEKLVALVDLGTNGEMVVGNRDRMVCASTAAGPAFEGARISMGMRAATGAITEIELVNGQLVCSVLGHVEPAGLCGSGLVDAVACGLELGQIRPNGRYTDKADTWMLMPPVTLSQTDVRQLQLAKGAIAAGMRILLEQLGEKPENVSRLYLAGAFGNYINRASAQRIGLLQFPIELIQPAGNTALLGAKMALFAPDDQELYAGIRGRMRHVGLNEDPHFMDIYVDEMSFPAE